MAWPINVGETVHPGTRPSLKLFALLFVCLTGACAAWAVWSWPHGAPVDMRFWLRAAVTPMLIGCTLLGLRINRYEQSVAASVASEESSAQTKVEWKAWTQRAIDVIACAAITPEQDLVAAMTSVPPTATASPHKGRKFHDWPDDGKPDPTQWAFEQLIRKLDEVLPEWRGCVQSVHVEGDLETERLRSAWLGALVVVQCPVAAPVFRFDASDWDSLFDEHAAGLRLFMAIQAWPFSREPQGFSELAVALLVSGREAKGTAATPLASIGRPMTTSTDTLDADLATLVDYCDIAPDAIGHLWFTGAPSGFPGALASSASLSSGAAGISSYSVDHHLGPAHIAQYWFALAAATEIQVNGRPQLVVGQTDKGLTVHLITGRQAAHHVTT